MIGDLIGEWIKGILIDGIMGNLSGLFNTVNTKVGEIASDVGSTPQDWNGGIFSMLQNLSETVVLPIAAAILACVMCMELIQMITEKNNMHDFDSSMFFRWIFKSAFAILIVSNTWNIVMGIFDATQSVVNQSAGVIIGQTSIDFNTLIPDLESQLDAMRCGRSFGPVVPNPCCGADDEHSFHLHFPCDLWPYGGNLRRDLIRAYPPCHNGQQRMARHGPRVFEIPAGAGLPSIFDYGCRRYLCGADSEHRFRV